MDKIEKKITNNKRLNAVMATIGGIFMALAISSVHGGFIGLVAGLVFGVAFFILISTIDALEDKFIAKRKAKAAKQSENIDEYQMKFELWMAEHLGLITAGVLMMHSWGVFPALVAGIACGVVYFIFWDKFGAFVDKYRAKKNAETAVTNEGTQVTEEDINQ